MESCRDVDLGERRNDTIEDIFDREAKINCSNAGIDGRVSRNDINEDIINGEAKVTIANAGIDDRECRNNTSEDIRGGEAKVKDKDKETNIARVVRTN